MTTLSTSRGVTNTSTDHFNDHNELARLHDILDGSTTPSIAVSIIESVNTVAASGAAVTIPDVTTATVNDVTLTANCTFTFPTAAAGKSFTLVLRQGGVGSFTVTWPGVVKWPGAVTPVLTTTVGKADVLSLLCTDGTNWFGFVGGLNF